MTSPIPLWVYLADQHEQGGRSLGISRMTGSVLGALQWTGLFSVHPVCSRSSLQWERTEGVGLSLPWSTRSAVSRLLADHGHAFLAPRRAKQQLWYYPKGFLPYFNRGRLNTAVTVHDTILQHYQDHYPEWRSGGDYRYWLGMLAHSLRNAGRVLTISHAAKAQIEAFMSRRGLPEREVFVTYEPCVFEKLPQPEECAKKDFALHLGSREPHKRTAWLVGQWQRAAAAGLPLPKLKVVGSIGEEIGREIAEGGPVEAVGFVSDEELQRHYRDARALVFPSEIEGFGLPALEAYYLGTPVCFVKGTSVEEVVAVTTRKGGFRLDEPESLFAALDEVLAMPAEEVRAHGLRLREEFAVEKVVGRMVEALRGAAASVKC